MLPDRPEVEEVLLGANRNLNAVTKRFIRREIANVLMESGWL
jgi:hypothetical protein